MVKSNIDMFVSVVIPTYNRETCVLGLLKSLFEQDYEHFEIIVIDQSDQISEEKQQFIKQYPNQLKYFHIKERGRSLAKNYGMLHAKGDIVLFCDDDIIPPANFLSTHASHYVDKTIGAVSCRLIEEGQPAVPVKTPLKTTFYGRLINKPYSTTSGFVTSLNGGNMSMRKTALEKSGFFEEYFAGTSMVEEPDLAFRIIKHGYKIYFDASITIMHFPQYNGNIAFMQSKRSEWFYFYFYNLLIFYTKYGRFMNIPFVLIYSVLLSLKHAIKYRLSAMNFFKMLNGFLGGFKRGYELFKENKNNNIYHTPCRYEKVLIKEIEL